MTSNPAGPAIVLAGVAIIVIGLLVWWGGFGWFGRLPGDIRIERDTVRIYIPLVSMLVISIVLTLLLNLISRFF
jgi:Zn-dependent protease with chaperone function